MEKKIIRQLARLMAAKLHQSESKDRIKKLGKGDSVVMVGSKNKYTASSKKQVCMECSEDCYFDDEYILRKDVTKDVKIKYCCSDCAYKKHIKKMTALQQEVMEQLK